MVARLEDWRWSSLGAGAVRQAHDCAGVDGKRVQLAQWPVARPAGWVEQVNAMVAKEELERLRPSVRRSRPFARRRLGGAGGAAAGLGINAARSVAAEKATACGKGDGFAEVMRSVPLQPSLRSDNKADGAFPARRNPSSFQTEPRGHGPTLFAGLSKRVDLRLVSWLELGFGGGGDALCAKKLAVRQST